MNPSFLSLCPDDNIKKKAVIPTAEYNRPVICQYTYRVSSVSTLLSELLFQTPEKRVHYTVSQHLYQVLINKLLIFLQLFLPGSHSRAHRPVSSIPLHSDHILHRDVLLSQETEGLWILHLSQLPVCGGFPDSPDFAPARSTILRRSSGFSSIGHGRSMFLLNG